MIRDYKNPKIYKNIKIVKILSIISLILSVVTFISFATKILASEVTENDYSFFLFLFVTPIIPLGYSRVAKKDNRYERETKLINDFNNSLLCAILTYSEVILLIFFFFIAVIFGYSDDAARWSFYVGYSFFSHICAYVAGGFIIHNCVLIKREWQEQPPEHIKKKQIIKEEKQQATQLNHNTDSYNKLIEKCGMRFFINYYSQIKRLPLRDIVITENYSSEEREERLLAAKKIIDSNLTEFTITQIINDYSDILTEDEITKAKSILSEISSSK